MEHLRQRLEKVEKSVERSQTTSNSWVPCIHDINLKNKEGLAVTNVSDNLSVKVDTNETVNDSDSAINTDSGSDSTVVEANYDIFSNPKEIKLSRILCDLYMCKHKCEQYLRNPKHLKSVQRPGEVNKRLFGGDLKE